LNKSQELCETLLRSSASPWPARLDSPALLQLYRTALCLEQLDSVDKKSEVGSILGNSIMNIHVIIPMNITMNIHIIILMNIIMNIHKIIRMKIIIIFKV